MNNVEKQYWKYGLHDAVITKIESKISNGKNCLSIYLDTENACAEKVSRIDFYSFDACWKGGRIKDFSHYINSWWIKDTLDNQGNAYKLYLTLKYEGSGSYEEITIQFENMTVIRENI